MRSRMMMTLLVPGAIALATACNTYSATAAVIPANEAWTEATSGGVGPWTWGDYEGGHPTAYVSLDAADKTTGTGSIKYTGLTGTRQGPAITFYGAADRPNLTTYAGGTLTYDFKISDATDYVSTQIFLYSGSDTTHSAFIGTVATAASLQSGWNHITVNLPATWPTANSFTPTQIFSVRFRLIYGNGLTGSRDVWFDNVKFTSVPEPASGGMLLLGGMILPMLRRRKPVRSL